MVTLRQHFHAARDKDDDSYTRLRCGRDLHANVDQSQLSGCGHVTALGR